MAAPMESNASAEELPSEIQARLANFDEALSKIEEVFEPLHSVPLTDIHSKIESLDKAKLDLIGAYAVNSLFWMYLNTKGENPKEHHIKTELDRIRGYMNRVKEIQEKQKAPKLDKEASKRFVRSALWQMAHKKAKQGGATTSTDNVAESTSTQRTETTSKQESSSQPENPEVITVSSQNSDSDGDETPSKKQKMNQQKKKKRKNKNKKKNQSQ